MALIVTPSNPAQESQAVVARQGFGGQHPQALAQAVAPASPAPTSIATPEPMAALAPAPVFGSPPAPGTGFAPSLQTPQFPEARYPLAGGENAQSSVPAPGRLINEEELKLLNAIAALQIRYGKSEEAIAWLALVRRQYPADYQSARLYAVALMKLGRFDEANQAIGVLEQLEHDGGFSLLYRSLIDFKNNQIASARNWFRQFLGQRAARGPGNYSS